jgi:tetratricopeptide (TPR) repeat protein
MAIISNFRPINSTKYSGTVISIMKYFAGLFTVSALLALAPAATAKTSQQIATMARATAVEIKLKLKNSNLVGSGVIVHRQGNVYTLVTNRHVVCGGVRCNQLPPNIERYRIALADGQTYQIDRAAVKLLGKDLDLAILQFRSDRNYEVAQVSPPGSLKAQSQVYTAGFPLNQPGFGFSEGRVWAATNKRVVGDRGGYSIVYDASTLSGMSGGGVFDTNGQLVAIHGLGDRITENTLVLTPEQALNIGNNIGLVTGYKLGYNRGISVRWLVQSLQEVGIRLNPNQPNVDRATGNPGSEAADEAFIAGFNKYVEPGADVRAGKQQAIQSFAKAIQLNPRYAFAYIARGNVYRQLAQYPEALRDFNQAIAIAPNLATSYVNRGSLKSDQLQDNAGALADINKAIALDPNAAPAYVYRGLLKQAKDPQGALRDYNKAIALDPKFELTYFARYTLKFLVLSDPVGGLADIDRFVALAPTFDLGYIFRGMTKYYLNDYPGTLAEINQMIARNPKNSLAYALRALLKENKFNDFPGALEDYNLAIAEAPQQAEFYNGRGLLKENKLKDYPGALLDYNQAIALKPNYPNAYNNRAYLKAARLKDHSGALADYSRAIVLQPDFTGAYYNRGNLKRNVFKDYQGALIDYNKVIALKADYVEAYYDRGVLKVDHLNDFQGGLADFNKVIVLKPDFAEAYAARGDLKFNKLNDFRGALADYNQLIVLQPDHVAAHAVRGNLKKDRLNDPAGALADYNRAIVLKPDYGQVYGDRALVKYQRLNDTSGAIQDLNTAIKLSANLENSYYNRGDFLYMTGRKAEALQDFRKVQSMTNAGLNRLVATGIVAMEQGQIAGAIANFNQAIKTEPQSGDTYKYRGLAYRRQGNTAQAMQDWQKAAQLYQAAQSNKDYQIVRGWLTKG